MLFQLRLQTAYMIQCFIAFIFIWAATANLDKPKFAGEDRAYVERIAKLLTEQGIHFTDFY